LSIEAGKLADPASTKRAVNMSFRERVKQWSIAFHSIVATLAQLLAILRINRPQIRRAFSNFLSSIGHVFRAFSAVRAPLFVSIFGVLVLSIPPQVQEIYRVISLNYSVDPGTAWKSLASLLLASLAILFLADQLSRRRLQFRKTTGIERFCLRSLPILSSGLLPVGAAVGLHWASAGFLEYPTYYDFTTDIPGQEDDMRTQTPELDEALRLLAPGHLYLHIGFWLCLLIVALVIGLGSVATRLPRSSWGAGTFKSATITGVITLLAIQVWLLAAIPVHTATVIGIFPLFFEFLIFIAFFTSVLIVRVNRYGWPATTLVFFAALLFSFFNRTDNHFIRTVHGSGHNHRDKLADSFDTWYKSRADLESYNNDQYPVIIVAAAGGGLYAALHVSTVLSRLQDNCPNFAQHVFAISGVSGGSLGSALFSALTKEFAKQVPYRKCEINQSAKSGVFETESLAFLTHDFLTPIVGAALFPDFLQRFIPFPIEAFDRARGLEDSFIEAWSSIKKSGPNPFNEPFLDHWDPKGVAPALVLNLTNADKGNQTAIAPFDLFDRPADAPSVVLDLKDVFSSANNSYEKDFYWDSFINFAGSSLDVRLATAVSMSARFAWITPAASVRDGSEELYGPQPAHRYVDGGYFENSGVERAMDLIKAIQKKQRNVRVLLLMVTAAGHGPDSSWNGLGELLSPIRAMLNTRARRGDLAVSRAIDEDKISTSLILLNLDVFPLPLGWQLSIPSQFVIREHSGHAGRKINFEIAAGRDEKDDAIMITIQDNDDEACRVQEFLNANYDPNICSSSF
jgi:hypothetical protein